MASSTLIFSRWILPFLFSFALSLFLFLSSIPVQPKPKISGRWEKSSEWKIESTSSFTRRSIRAQRGSWHTFVVTETVYGILRWSRSCSRHLLPCRASDTRVSRTRKNRVGDPERPDSREIARVCAIQPWPRRWPSIVAFPFSWRTVPAHLDQILPVPRMIFWFLAYRLSLSLRFSDKEIVHSFFFNINRVIY